MNPVLAVVLAVIGTSGIPVWFLQRFDKRNSAQHASNMEILTETREEIREIKHDIRDVKQEVRDIKTDVANLKKGKPDGVTGRTATDKRKAVRSKGASSKS
jgi:hypothetical protein